MGRLSLAWLVAWSAVGAASFAPRVAWAQSAPAIGDEVKLRDGSIYRGTIVEFVPSDHVDLLLPNGQTKRFNMADVAYEGAAPTPAPPAPPAEPTTPPPAPTPAVPQPAVTVRTGKVDVHVTSDQDDVTLLYPTGQSDFDAVGAGYRSVVAISGMARNYEIVCTAPCDAQLPAGEHRLALSLHGGRGVEAAEPVHLDGPSTMRVHYESRVGMRALGWVLLAGSVVAGTILVVDASTKTQSSCAGSFTGAGGAGGCAQPTQMPAPDMGEMIGGLVVTAVGSLLSLVFILQRDKAHIEIVPQGASRLLRLPGAAEPVVVAPAEAPGMGVRVRF